MKDIMDPYGHFYFVSAQKILKELVRDKLSRNFKRPKNGEDGFDFDDFWTKRIAALSAKFCKIFALSKKFSRGRKLQKTFAKSSKKFVPRAISGEKQNRNGYLCRYLVRIAVSEGTTSTMDAAP